MTLEELTSERMVKPWWKDVLILWWLLECSSFCFTNWHWWACWSKMLSAWQYIKNTKPKICWIAITCKHMYFLCMLKIYCIMFSIHFHHLLCFYELNILPDFCDVNFMDLLYFYVEWNNIVSNNCYFCEN